MCMQMGKIFASHTYDKELIFKIYEQLIQLCKKMQRFFQWTKNLNRHIFKEDTQMAKRYMKKYSTSLIIKEIQIKIH